MPRIVEAVKSEGRQPVGAPATLAALLLVGFAVLPRAEAQIPPDAPIKVIVALSAGGPTDIGMRAVGKEVTDRTGRPIVVENRPGGGGTIAALVVKQARPDGLTVLAIDNATCCANLHLGDRGYDTLKDFKPVLLLWGYPLLLVVPGSSPVRSVADLAELAHKKSGGLSFASQGIGAGGHIMGEMFARALKAPMVHVPYQGAAPAARDVSVGQVDFFMGSYASISAYIQDGRIRPIASTAETGTGTVPGHPALPTLAESGYPEMRLGAWFLLVAPAATPDATVQELHALFARALRADAVVERLAGLKMQVFMTETPADLARKIKAETDWIGPIMKSAGIKAE